VAHLEPRLFKKTKRTDVEDSAQDMREAFDEHDELQLAEGSAGADATILVLERGYRKTLGIPGARQVRVRVSAGGQSIELVASDKALGFNTWKGAAKMALEQSRQWIEATLQAPPRP
jgi:hypothetical protein